MLKLRNNNIRHILEPDISLQENLALIDEQIRIERLSLIQEVKALREELSKYTHKCDIRRWEDRVDDIYERLYFYKKGICSRIKLKHGFFLHYSYRRTIRSFFS